MPTYSKRGDKWRVEVCVAGVRVSATRRTKADAALWAAQRENEMRNKAEGKMVKRTVAEAFEQYATKICPTHKGERWEKVRLNMLLGYMPGGFDLAYLCKMFGWKDPKQAMVYFNPNASDMASRLG